MADGLRSFGLLSHLEGTFAQTTTELGAWGAIARSLFSTAEASPGGGGGGGPFRVPGMAIGPGGVPTVTVAGCCDCSGGGGNGATYAECEISCDTTTFTRWPVTWCTNSFIGMTGSGPAACTQVAEAIAMTEFNNAPPYTPPCLAPVWNRGPTACGVGSVQHSMQFGSGAGLGTLELLVTVSDGVNTAAQAVYRIPCPDLNMDKSNIMDLIVVGGYDVANYNFPASITITPCPTP